MGAKPSQKITFLNHRYLMAYKVWCILMITALCLMAIDGIYRLVSHGGGSGLPVILPALIFAYRFLTLFKSIRGIEYDSEFLYVFESGYEVVIPLRNIKRIDIRNFGGIYEVSLFDPIQSGYSVLFMPSLIYPLDFRKQDEKVNMLRRFIQKARRTPDLLSGNALHS